MKDWSQQVAELQTLRTDAEKHKKAGDKFYKMDEESIVTIQEELSEDFFALAEAHLKEVWGLVERLDDGQLDIQLQLEKYEEDRQQQEAEGRTTPITISDEERPAGETTKDTEEPRQARPEDEPPVGTNEETTAISEEQLHREAGTTKDVATNQPVDTGESDTNDGQDPGTEEEQRELEGSREEEPLQQGQTRVDELKQQPSRPEADKEKGTEQQTSKAPLDPFEQSLLDILDEE